MVCNNQLPLFSYCLFPLSTPSSKPLVDARGLLEELRNQQPSPPPRSTQTPPTAHPLRGPFLGRLEMVKQITQNGLQNILELPSPATLLLDYFSMFGTKSCCFDDLRSYFEFFSPDELKKFMVMAEAKIAENPIKFDCSEKDRKRNVSILRRQISMMQLQRYCGLHGNLSLDKKRDLVLLCKHLYREGLKLATGVPETDTKPADFFVVLAVHLLIEIYVETREWRVLWQAILLLEHSRSMKTTNPQILLLLLKLYGFLGAAEGITDIFESLNIKHLQMETLGYIPLRYLQASVHLVSLINSIALHFASTTAVPRRLQNISFKRTKTGCFKRYWSLSV
ncbi:N-alpha-acetyltransferase 25, NatB auxiliary subunit [Geodia barretti]|uniref:N-alpha-acetyltransferase 25, NatB auxiliary subunit n=1 Tax=Geodia barretti TaxID=519541 RepID=A0AA35WIN3_GEOBA|nr:N-alpha-acetyltransferase 25, NatB auxiliary subunit [Geodia barretti]